MQENQEQLKAIKNEKNTIEKQKIQKEAELKGLSLALRNEINRNEQRSKEQREEIWKFNSKFEQLVTHNTRLQLTNEENKLTMKQMYEKSINNREEIENFKFQNECLKENILDRDEKLKLAENVKKALDEKLVKSISEISALRTLVSL